MKQVFTLTVLVLLGGWLVAQPVSTFPFVENFDAFPTSPQGSGNEPNPNAFPNGWVNEQTDDGPQDWYAGVGNTPSANTGPTGDHTTGSGVYLYIEDSGRDNDEVSLLTPFFNLTSLGNGRLAYWVHSNANVAGAFYGGDSSFNDLKVDYFDGVNWTNLDSVGVLGTGWTERILDISALPTFVRFRFRVNNNNFGDFVHDIAIDDVSVYNQPDIDGAVISAAATLTTPSGYTQAPVSQGPGYQLSGSIQNRGLQTLTNLVFKADFGTYVDSATLASLASFQTADLTMPGMFMPTVASPGTFSLSATENDTFPENDAITIAVTDSVFARDDSTANGGLGFTGGSGIFGNMFELTQPDVLTSVSYFLNSSTLGDSIRILLYGFGNDIPGQPDTLGGLLDSSAYFTISQLGWNTSVFPCQIPLAPGQYFIAVEQVNLNNLGFGYDLDNFQPGVTFFGDGVGPWTDYANLPASLQGHNLLRMNFGPTSGTSLTADATAICPGDSVILTASGSGIFNWGGPNVPPAIGNSITVFPDSASTYLVSLVDPGGCFSIDSIEINVGAPPTVSLSGDSLVCAGSPATLTAAGGVSYLWSTGETTETISPAPTALTTYVVTVSDAFGCSTTDSVTVRVNDTPTVSLDSTLAFFGIANGTATATPAGGTPPYTFLWDDPAAQDSATATGLTPGTYSVTVTDANGCSVTGTVNVTEATTAIEGQLEAGLIQVFPNPVQEYLILRGLEAFGPQAEVRVTVLDLQGREVLRAVRHNEQELRLDLPATLPDGVYMIDLQSETLRAQARVVRQR